MCVVALAWNIHPRWRLVVAGNRDEAHARPAAALSRWPDLRIRAGRDLQAGGTWLGLGRDARMAVVTNVRNGLPRPFIGPSRGDLPVAFLTGAQAAAEYAAQVAAQAARYAPFNLVLADAHDCLYVGNHPGPAWRRLAPGVHALSNGPLDADWPKVRRLRMALQAWVAAGDDDPQPLWQALADETPATDAELPDTGVGLALERRLSPCFIRGVRYGTRASTLLRVDAAGRGHICERRFGPGGVFLGETTLAD
ncbi:NRDE family protein [Thermomonas sp. S9]|uniref:NRDE family protein n=1 Tax=Thermomonas sp. S9 TaxID=2885203 RepID=UPI00216AEB4B|nr:NRDE family protein [Thermomonas sp. S9]MCR6494837.1 NRDE family protein [Thermomonas sp. S9]